MRSILKAGNGLFVPFHITEPLPHASSWFGGGAPDGAPYDKPAQTLEHIVTLQPEGEVAITVLATSNFDVVLEKRLQLHDANSTSEAVVAILHESGRSEDPTHYPSRFPRCGLCFDLPLEEIDAIDPESAWTGHKIGGCPSSIGPEIRELWRELYADGFRLVLQFSFPDSQDLVLDGNWPFGEDYLYLFTKPDTWEFKYFIGT